MKRIILLLILILCNPYPAQGFSNAIQAVISAGGVASTWSCTDAGYFCESFDTDSGYDMTGWAAAGTSESSTVTPDYSNTTAVGLNNPNVESLQIVKGDSNSPTATNTLGSTADNVYGCFNFYVSAHFNSSNTKYPLVKVNTNWGRTAIGLYQTGDGSSSTLWVGHHNKADSIIYDSVGALTINKWHRCTFVWTKNQDSGGLTVTIDGSAVTIADGGSTYTQPVTTFIGTLTGYNRTLLIDAIKMSKTGAPDCN